LCKKSASSLLLALLAYQWMDIMPMQGGAKLRLHARSLLRAVPITFYTKPRIAIVDKMNLTADVTDTDAARVSRELIKWPGKTLLCLRYPDGSLTIFVSPPPDKIRSIGGVVDIAEVPGYVIEVRHE